LPEEISLTRLTPIIIVKKINNDIDQLLSIAGHSFKVTSISFVLRVFNELIVYISGNA
jgi:hypothetical protein